MKLITALVFFCFTCICALAQAKENKTSPADLGSKIFSLQTQDGDLSLELPFSKIRVIDARFDTSKLGFVANRVVLMDPTNRFERLKLRGGTAAALENYYANSHLNRASLSEYGLLIVIKKFWISSTRAYDFQKQSLSLTINGESRLTAKWELYIFKNDEYLPFRRIDTSIESTQSVRQLFKDENATDYNKENIYSILDNFIGKYNYARAIAIFADRAKKSLKEINDLNNERFQIPIISENKIRKGVFKDFNEFKNNAPSLLDFTEKGMKYSLTREDQFLVDAKGVAITNYWAYSTDKYARIGPYGNETIFRSGKTFDFFVKKRIATTRSQGDIVYRNHYMIWIPYQIDMETGEFY